MQRMFSGYPPRYTEMLHFTLKAALVRLLPLVPFFFAYFQPFSPWFRLVVIFCPVLWVLAVCPMRVRYARAMSAVANNQNASLPLRGLFSKDRAWASVCRGRIRLMRWWALLLYVSVVFLLLVLWFTDAFSAMKVLLNIFGGIATAISTVAAFIPRLFMGVPLVQQAGIFASVIALAVTLIVSLALFGWGAFQSSLYRFGRTEGMPKAKDMAPLFKKNLWLWMPTLLLLFALVVLSYKELGLLAANFLSAEPVFSVKLQITQIILLSLTAISYLLLLPLRKLNTARWALSAH